MHRTSFPANKKRKNKMAKADDPSEEDLYAFMREARSQVFVGGDEAASEGGEGGESREDTDGVEQPLQWMFADAGVFKALARANPLRWSARLPAREIQQQLLQQSVASRGRSERPVSLRVCGQRHVVTFTSAAVAAEWVRSAASEIDQQKVPKSLGLLGLGLLIAPAACTVFLRANAQTSWHKKNVFAASLYARRITQLPHRIARMQEHVDVSAHTRRSDDSYARWESSEAKQLIAFIDAASLPMEARPREMQVCLSFSSCPSAAALSSRLWVCVENEPFWMGWLHEESGASVIAFRGGDGGKEDACNHPGSPLRAFIHGDNEKQQPELPMALVRRLAAKAAEARQNGAAQAGGLSIVGYSQGGIPALACALSFGLSDLPQETLERVELLNAATMFWPTWFLPPLLSEDWWTNAPAVSAKIRSWVIKDDPLSEGLPGRGGFRAPATPGTTIVLPPKHFDRDLIHNHDLSNFK